MIARTNITHTDDNMIQLSRLIDSKLVVIKFNIDINAVKLVPYFNMPDEKFKLFLR